MGAQWRGVSLSSGAVITAQAVAHQTARPVPLARTSHRVWAGETSGHSPSWFVVAVAPSTPEDRVMDIGPWVWWTTVVLTTGFLLVDVVVIGRRPHEPS